MIFTNNEICDVYARLLKNGGESIHLTLVRIPLV